MFSRKFNKVKYHDHPTNHPDGVMTYHPGSRYPIEDQPMAHKLHWSSRHSPTQSQFPLYPTI